MPDMRVETGDVSFNLWPFGAPILALLFVVLLVVMWRRKHNFSYLLCLTVFSVYLLFAADKAFFPIPISGTYADVMRQVPFMTQVNLIPFSFGPFGTLESSAETMLLNVLLTLPFGFGMSFIAPIRMKQVVWIALAVGFGTELTQLIISLLLGYAYRFIDINDVLMNASGVLIGYIIFRILGAVYLWVIKRLGIIKPWGLAGYIHEVTQNARTSRDAVPATDA